MEETVSIKASGPLKPPTLDEARKTRIRNDTEQFAVFVVGSLVLAFLSYVLYVFGPYFYPVAMAALISIPIRPLTKRLNRFLRLEPIEKIKILGDPQSLLIIIPLSVMLYEVVGLVATGCIVGCFTLATLLTRRIKASLFLCLATITLIIIPILVIWIGAGETVSVASGLFAGTKEHAFKSTISNILDRIDVQVKQQFNVGLYETISQTMSSLGLKDPESSWLNFHSRPTSASNLATRLQHLASSASFGKIFDRLKNLLTPARIVQASEHLLQSITYLIGLLLKSADALIQSMTFIYFLFLFINNHENILRYIAKLFYWIDEFQVFVGEVENVFEHTIASYIRKIVMELCSSYLIFKMCGSDAAITAAMLSTQLAIFPLIHPSIVSLMVAAELLVKGQTILAISCLLLHLIVNFKFIGSLTLYKFQKSSYFAELSVLVGFRTFGYIGLVMGPILASLPIIIHRLLDTSSKARQ